MPPVQIDLSGLADLFINGLVTALQHLFSPIPGNFEEWLWSNIQHVLADQQAFALITHIPTQWTAQNADVLLLWKSGLFIEGPLGGLVLMIGGYYVMSGKMDIWYVVFRFGFLVIAGEAMAFWSLLIINFVNAASDAVGSSPMDIRTEMMPNDLVLGIMLIVLGFFAFLAWIKGAVGVIFIDVLIVSAPYLLTLSAIPLLNGLSKWWVEEFTTWMLRPFLVALVLRLGLGLGLINNGGLQLLFAIIAFWLAYSMDTRIRRFSVGAWGNMATYGAIGRAAGMARQIFSR